MHLPRMRCAARKLAAALSLGLLAACGDEARLKESDSVGPQPVLPPANPPGIPTVNIAPALGWIDGGAPKTSSSFSVTRFASGLDHPRGLHVLANGDVLVAEATAPQEAACKSGLEEWIARWVMSWAGARSHSANRITLLRDADGDGVAEVRVPLLTAQQGLKSPFGMVVVGRWLYVANTNAVLRFPWAGTPAPISAAGEKVGDLPAAGGNCHWTRNLLASRKGTKLYATIGANSDHGEHGTSAESGRAQILEIDLTTGGSKPFASGLRNPVGLDWEPVTGALWVTVSERDELGSDLVPDYMTAVRAGAFYGWPCYYFGEHLDPRVPPEWQCPKATRPDYALGTHTTPMGIAFSDPAHMPEPFARGAFVAQHGSWNRKPRTGYKVIFVPFEQGQPGPGAPVDVLWGFVDQQPNMLFDEGRALGRPVSVALHPAGALLVSDDVGNAIWRVAPKRQ